MRRSGRQDATSRVAHAELIGTKAKVVASNDPTLLGLQGTVVDETERTFVLEKDDGRAVRVGKRGQRFAFVLEGEPVEVDGSALAHHPADRIKKMR